MKKTNAMRILDGLGIEYEAAEYEDDGEHELARGAAGRMAEKLGVAPETVFKTIVMRTETKEICVFYQSAVSEINLKKARQAAGFSRRKAVPGLLHRGPPEPPSASAGPGIPRGREGSRLLS